MHCVCHPTSRTARRACRRRKPANPIDAFDVAPQRAAFDTPHATEVGRSCDQWFVAPGGHRGRPVAPAPPVGRRLDDRDVGRFRGCSVAGLGEHRPHVVRPVGWRCVGGPSTPTDRCDQHRADGLQNRPDHAATMSLRSVISSRATIGAAFWFWPVTRLSSTTQWLASGSRRFVWLSKRAPFARSSVSG